MATRFFKFLIVSFLLFLAKNGSGQEAGNSLKTLTTFSQLDQVKADVTANDSLKTLNAWYLSLINEKATLPHYGARDFSVPGRKSISRYALNALAPA